MAANGYLSVTNSTTVGTNDFTIEAWVYVNTATMGLTHTIFSIGTPQSGISLRVPTVNWSGDFTQWFEVYINNTQYRSWTFCSLVNGWFHVGVSRIGTTLSLYSNYTNATFPTGYNQTWTIASYLSIPAGTWYIGNDSNATGNYLRGYIDDVRLTIGKGLYSSSYSTAMTPASAFPNGYNASLTGTVGSLGLSGTDVYVCTAAGTPGTWKYLALQNVAIPSGYNELAQNLTGYVVGSVPITATNPFASNTTEGAFTFNGSAGNYLSISAAQTSSLMTTASVQDM